MKKQFTRLLCLLCLGLLCLSLWACNSSDTFSLDMAELAAANNTEAILKSYGNYHVRWSSSKDGMPSMTLITPDYVYCDSGELQELYSRDGRTYEKSLGVYTATVRFPSEVEAYINNGYFASPVVDAGAADEEILSVTKADEYQLSVTTKLSAERSAQIVRSFGDDGSFAYVKAVYLVSKDSLLINDLTYYCVRENGTQRELAGAHVSYNTKGMWDAESMYSRVSNTSSDMRTVTVILDHDTPNERSITVFARKGDPLAFYLGDDYKAIYSDRECTLPYRGDGIYEQDETLYCRKSEANAKLVEMSDIVDFNTTESVLSMFENYYVKWSVPKNGMGTELILSRHYLYYLNGKTPELYTEKHTYEKSGSYFVATLREAAEVEAFLANPYLSAPLIDGGAADEEILVREISDYYHHITAKLTPERSAEILAAFDQTNVYEYVKAKYTVTRATYAITSLTYYGVNKHGDEIKIAEATVEYQVKNTVADEMYAHITDETVGTRTVTVILDPDTPNERAVSTIARKGDPVALRAGESYTTLYTDRECTQQYQSDGTYSSDQTLYCKASAQEN